jgi:hypothetical protein
VVEFFAARTGPELKTGFIHDAMSRRQTLGARASRPLFCLLLFAGGAKELRVNSAKHLGISRAAADECRDSSLALRIAGPRVAVGLETLRMACGWIPGISHCPSVD